MKRSSWAYPSRRQFLLARPAGTAVFFTPFLLLTLALGGCADPAADAPDAVVTEASPHDANAPAASADLVDYAIDAASSTIGFVGSKVTGSHEGGFQAFEGSISADPVDLTTGTVEVVIDATSIWSDDERLTDHLKSEDFFAVENFPTASFTSTEIVETETGYEIAGNLDLHGVEKQIRFPATIEVSDNSITAVAEFSIRRFDFGIEYPGRADDLIRDEVLIQLNLTAHAS